MDPIAFLYSIPVLGLVFELIGYLIDIIPDISPFILRAGTPLVLGALCGVLCERSGVVNIGIEGTMLARAFTGWAVGVAAVGICGPGDPGAVFGITPALLIGLVAAVLVAVVISALHAWLSISVRADQIIGGTIINIAAFGVTGYLNTLLATSSPIGAGGFTTFAAPSFLTDIPVIGWVFAMFLNRDHHDVGAPVRHRDQRPAVPVPLGPSDTSRRGASEGGGDGRHRRHPTAVPQRDRRRCPGRTRPAHTSRWRRRTPSSRG